MTPFTNRGRIWCLNGRERVWLFVGLLALLAFGVNVEQRTALRRTPMTDLGVFTRAAQAVCAGENPYTVMDWHGWHYQYPPALAILLAPIAVPVPTPPALEAGVARTELNTPWGFEIASHRRFFGLHEENARFFCIVGAWYILSVVLAFFSAHALACALEGRNLREGPPVESRERRRWWWMRLLPLLVCAGSLGTDLSRGQVDVFMLAAISFGIYLAAAGRDLKAGFWLSLPATVKLFPILLLLHPLWRRRWRTIAGAAAGVVLAVVIIPLIVLGPARTFELSRTWFDVLAKPALGQSTDATRTRELTGMAGTDNQSLLAFIHNWRYHNLPREKRPPEAPPVERYIAYATGAMMLLGVMLAMGRCRRDEPRNLVMIAGLLMGAALVISPVSHNYYFLLMLLLIAGLMDYGLPNPGVHERRPKVMLVIAAFMLIDILARLPAIGPWLRDLGVPLLSVVGLMAAGIYVLTSIAIEDEVPGPLIAESCEVAMLEASDKISAA